MSQPPKQITYRNPATSKPNYTIRFIFKSQKGPFGSLGVMTYKTQFQSGIEIPFINLW